MSRTNYLRWKGYPFALTLLFITLLCTCARAQDIRLNVIVPNPPPVTWEAYLEFDANVRVIITNVGTVPHDLKLIPTLTSDRGLSAAFQPDYQPLSPLTIGPGETVNLTYRELRALFGTPEESDINLQGISFDRLFASETIPEGSYTLCVEAREYTTSEPLSNNFGCAVFFVQQHEPPLIIWPFDDEVAPATEPQFLNFLWSTTGVPGRTRYRFALYDLDELGLFNNADAFILEATRPYFEADDLVASNLAYDLALPPLTPGHHYAVQVSAYDPEGELLFAQGGRSAIHRFLYQAQQVTVTTGGGIDTGGPGAFDTEGPETQIAMQACPDLDPPLANPYLNGLTAGQTVSVGNHAMVLNSGGAMPLAGTGRVHVESLNAWVNVSFTGLEVNQAEQVYGGTVAAVVEGNPNLNNLTEAAALQLADLVDANGSWLEGNNGSPVNLPVGLAGAGMDLILTGMTFTPLGATLDLFGKVEIPEALGSRRLLLIGQGACLNDENLGANMDLLLANDQSFTLGPGVEMTFASGEEGTRLRWNTDGIDRLDVDLSLGFAPSVMPGGQAFSARVTAQVEDYQDWLGTVTTSNTGVDPPPVMLTLNYEQVEWVYDHSALQNPDGMTLPAAHPDHDAPNLWQGLYLAEFEVIFPQGFDVTIGAENLLLDQSGVWTRVSAQGNLLDINEGEIGGWALGIDGLELDYRGSGFEVASFDGRVRLPLGDTEIGFSAPLQDGQDITIALDIGQEVEVDMWLADLELADNSTVGFTRVGEVYRPTALLHGSISMGWDSPAETGEENVGVSQYNLPGLDFENFRITGGASPSVEGTFGLDGALPQGSMQNFPLQLTKAGLMLEGEDIGLSFDIGLSLNDSHNGFSGTTTFTLIGRLENNRYAYDRTRLDQLTVDAELNLISLHGSLDIFDSDGTYGTGFDGSVAVDIEQIGAGLDMRLMVGRAPAGFRYFMVDALVKLPDYLAIPIGATPLGFYGFGGGFWRNMDRQASMPAALNYDDLETVDQSNNDPGEGATTVFLPASGQTGFSMKTIIGLMGSRRALNGDLELVMEIEDDFSLNEISLIGNIYVAQDIGDRGDAFIHGKGELRLAPAEGLYTLSSQLTVELPAKFATVVQPLFAGFRTQNNPGWWFYLGQWTPGEDPIFDEGRFRTDTYLNFGLGEIISTRNGYFMMGTEMPDGLPGVPAEVSGQFAQDGKELPGQQFNGNAKSYNPTNGIAFGVGREMDLSFRASIFDLDVGYTWGFDLLLADMSDSDCDSGNFGLNKWYARGQAWAHCHVKGSVKGRLFGETREFKFAEFDASALLQFQGPNPIWIKGNVRIRGSALGKRGIKFNANVGVEFGEKIDCQEFGGSIFDEIPIVEQVNPKQGTTARSIFTAPEASFNFPNRALAIDEGTEDSPKFRYYGYKVVSLQIDTMGENGSDFGTFLYITDPNKRYDEEGYAAVFDLPELPPNATIKVILKTQGLQYQSSLGLTVIDDFNVQVKESTFKTGPPPDRILKHSIVNTVPFRRQLYFTKNDHPTARIDWYQPQYSELFRDKPNAEDKLDPAGSFSYVARFVRMDNESYYDVPITDLNENTHLSFATPTGWLQPEMGYRIDVLRMYTAPEQNGPATDTVLVELELYEGGTLPYVSTEAGLAPGNNGVGGGVSGGGYSQIGTTQLMFSNQVGQSANGIGQTLTFGGGDGDDPGPDPGPGPTLGALIPDGGGYGGPSDFANPGGNMEGLERYSSQLMEESRTSAVAVKNLWPKGQSPWYFRTSRYNRLSEKITGLEVVNDGDVYQRTVKVTADDLYSDNVEYVDLPYVRLRTNEPFDRFETKYWFRNFRARDGGQIVGAKFTQKFYPAVEVQSPTNQWKDQVFYGAPTTGSTNGLFREPLGDVDAWCEEVFDHPDSGVTNTTPCQGEDENSYNAPLHHFQTHTWDAYMTVVPGPKAWGGDSPPGMNQIGYQDWVSLTRYGADTPFGRNKYGRRLPSPTDAMEVVDMPTIEITQWKKSGVTPDGLAGSGAQSTHTWFDDGMVEAYQGNGQVNPNLPGGIGDVTIYVPPEQMAQAQPYLTLIDFTEWVTLKDYFGMRRIIGRGIDVILDVAENDLNLSPGQAVPSSSCDAVVLLQCISDYDGDPTPVGPLPDLDGVRPFATFYYPQLRRWLKHKGTKNFGESEADYHQYYVRPADSYQVRLQGRNLNYQLPQMNATSNWD